MTTAQTLAVRASSRRSSTHINARQAFDACVLIDGAKPR